LSLDEKQSSFQVEDEEPQLTHNPTDNKRAVQGAGEAGEEKGGEPGDKDLSSLSARQAVGGGEQGGPVHPPPVEEDEGVFFPDQIVKLIQQHIMGGGESPGGALLHLLSMSSVCKQWRGLASELPAGSAIAFDCFDNLFSNQPAIQKFRRYAKKETVFWGAAKLLTGYTDVTFSGDAVSDRVLQEAALQAGPHLARCRVSGSSAVTDTGLSALVAQFKALESLEVEDLGKHVTGKTLAHLFERCAALNSLHLSNLPGMNWAPCVAYASSGAGKDLGLTKLHVRGVNLGENFGIVLSRLPNLHELELDGPARNLKSASVCCPKLQRVSYQVSSRPILEEALDALTDMKELRQLELVVKNFMLCADQLRTIGMLPLFELRLDSFIHKQQPTLSRSSYSHVDNEGVKALVDSICHRWCAIVSDVRPLKLSLCGGTALTHDAVSALLRLPILTELDIGGCCRIIAMDKMRLVAKVRAGREMLDSGRRPSMRSSRFPGLML